MLLLNAAWTAASERDEAAIVFILRNGVTLTDRYDLDLAIAPQNIERYRLGAPLER